MHIQQYLPAARSRISMHDVIILLYALQFLIPQYICICFNANMNLAIVYYSGHFPIDEDNTTTAVSVPMYCTQCSKDDA